jgi:hypothetical protein
MAHEILFAEEPRAGTKGWTIVLEVDGVCVGYPFGENVVADTKRGAIQMIKDLGPGLLLARRLA